MKLSGYLAILGTCLCGQFFASAQPASNQTTNLLGPKAFVFSGGSFNQFVTALTEHYGTNLTQMLDWPDDPPMRIPKMRVGPTHWIGVLKTYNTISAEGDGFLGKWIFNPPFWNGYPAPMPETLVFVPPKPAVADGEVQVRAFPIRGMPKATMDKLREAIEQQAAQIRRRFRDDSAIRGEVNVHEGTGLLVAAGGKTYVDLVGTLVEAFNVNFPYPRPGTL